MTLLKPSKQSLLAKLSVLSRIVNISLMSNVVLKL
jgi:hypothetical protein